MQKESVVEEKTKETGNTARAFVNGVWVDDNEKFACKYKRYRRFEIDQPEEAEILYEKDFKLP